MLIIVPCCSISQGPIYGRSPLHRAVYDLEFRLVEERLALGDDVNGFGEYSEAPLYFLYRIPSHRPGTDLATIAQMATFLIDRGANPNLPNKYGHLPLVESASNGVLPLAQALVEGGAIVDRRGVHGQTALGAAIEAVENTRIDAATYLREKGLAANRRVPFLNYTTGRSFVDGSVEYVKSMPADRAEMIRYLLSAGASPNAPARHDAEPLQIAAYHGRLDYVEILLEAGADPNHQQSSFQTYTYYDNGDTISPRSVASRQKWLEREAFNGYTALHCASLIDDEAHRSIVKRLLAAGADPTRKDRLGRTPVELARQKKCPGIVATFAAAGRGG